MQSVSTGHLRQLSIFTLQEKLPPSLAGSRSEKAKAIFDRALSFYEESLFADNLLFAHFWEKMAEQYHSQRIRPLAARCLILAGHCYRAVKIQNFPGAIRCYEGAAKIFTLMRPAAHEKAARSYAKAAQLYALDSMSDFLDYKRLVALAVDHYFKTDPPSYFEAALCLREAAQTFFLRQNRQEAVPYFLRAARALKTDYLYASDSAHQVKALRGLHFVCKQLTTLHTHFEAARCLKLLAKLYRAHKSTRNNRLAGKIYDQAAKQYCLAGRYLPAIKCCERGMRSLPRALEQRIGDRDRYYRLLQNDEASRNLPSPPKQVTSHLANTLIKIPEEKQSALFIFLYSLSPQAKSESREIDAIANLLANPKISSSEVGRAAAFVSGLQCNPNTKASTIRRLLFSMFNMPKRDRELLCKVTDELQLPKNQNDIESFFRLWNDFRDFSAEQKSFAFALFYMLWTTPQNTANEVYSLILSASLFDARRTDPLLRFLNTIDKALSSDAKTLGQIVNIAAHVPFKLLQQLLLALQGIGVDHLKRLLATIIRGSGIHRKQTIEQLLNLSALLKPNQLFLITDFARALQTIPPPERTARVERILHTWEFLTDIMPIQAVPSVFFPIPIDRPLISTEIFFVKRNLCLDSPRQILLALRALVHLMGKLPNKLQYNDCQAEDGGGVTRDVITSLFDGLYTHGNYYQLPVQVEKEGILPKIIVVLNPDIQKEMCKCYEAIGMIFSFALQSVRDLRSGPYFHPLLFEMLHLLSKQEMEEICSYPLESLLERTEDKEVYNHLLEVFLQNHSWKNTFGNTPEEVKKQVHQFIQKGILPSALQEAGITEKHAFLQTYNIHAILAATLCIARGIYLHRGSYLWEDLKTSSVDSFATTIQGAISFRRISLALRWQKNYPERIAKMMAHWEVRAQENLVHQYLDATSWIEPSLIDWLRRAPREKLEEYLQIIENILAVEPILSDLVKDLKCIRTQRFLLDWISKSTEEERKNFLQAITGSCSLGPNQDLYVSFYPEADNLASFHTCDNLMDLPSEYPDFATFEQKMNHAISCVKHGFQVR